MLGAVVIALFARAIPLVSAKDTQPQAKKGE